MIIIKTIIMIIKVIIIMTIIINHCYFCIFVCRRQLSNAGLVVGFRPMKRKGECAQRG